MGLIRRLRSSLRLPSTNITKSTVVSERELVKSH